MSRIALALLSLLLVEATPSAPPRPERSQPEGKGGQFTQSATQQQETPTPPPMTTIDQPRHAPTETATPQRDTNPSPGTPGPPTDSGWSVNVWLAIFTGGLVIVGFLQVRLLCGSLQETRKAADAATRSAEAVIHADRPFLMVTGVKFEYITDGTDSVVKADVILHNFGICPADIIDYIVECEIFDIAAPGTPQDIIVYGNDGHPINDSIVGSKDTVSGRIVVWASLDKTERQEILADRKRVGAHGRIRYRGTPQQEYWTRFHWWSFAGFEKASNARCLEKEHNAHS